LPSIGGGADRPQTERGGCARRRDLGSGETREHACAEGHERCAPTVELRYRRRDRRRERRNDCGQKSQAEHLDDDRDGDHVGGDGDERDLVELEPGDGRSRDSACCRDADELRELTGNGVSLECANDARRDDEDRRDGGERELEAGIEERVRIPAEEHGSADEQGLPAITFATGQPRERTETSGERSADNGRVEPDGERVRDDGQQSGDLGEIDSEAEEQDHGGSATAHRSDLQPIDGETVVEARGAEIVEQLLVDHGRAAEHDRLDHVASLALQARDGVSGEPTADAVAEAGDSAAPAGDPPFLSTKDSVDALSPQPLRLVEAVRRSGWSP